MTRAREQLYCLHALERRWRGQPREQSPSSFLTEIPEAVKQQVRLAAPRRAPQQTWRERPLAPRHGESTKSVLSFFQNAPVQFDPNAIRPAKSELRDADLKRGARVRHEQFGEGTILTMEGSGPDAKLTVYFDRAGSKKFIARYAKLTRI